MPDPRRWPWALLTPVLLVVGAALGAYAADIDLLRFFLPMREVAIGAALVGAGAVGLTVWATHRTLRSKAGLAAGLLVVVAVVVAVREIPPYETVEVTFESGGVTLAGTVYLPAGEGPFPAVAIGHGSLRAPRRLYHLWADGLARRGVAVLSADKRGTGASGGVYQADNNASADNLRLLASDVARAAEVLRARPEVAADRVGVYGLSMGGWLAPLAAEQSDAIAFFAVNAGPAVSVGEEGAYSALAGDTPRRRTAAEQARIDRAVAEEPPSGYDPRPTLGRLDVPAFWQLAARDSSVPTAKSVAVLDSLIAAGKPYAYTVYAEADHLGFSNGWPFALPATFLDDLAGWIRAR